MAAYFFASPVDVDIKLDDEEDRKKVEIKGDKEKLISCPVYYDGESISGQVCPLSALPPTPVVRARSSSTTTRTHSWLV